MSVDLVVRGGIAVVMVAMIGVSGHYRRRAAAFDGSARRSDEPTSTKLLRLIVALPGFAVFLAALLAPGWVTWSTFAAPTAVRFAGLGVAALGVPLAAWLFPHLGHNVTATTLTKERHTLVTTGPYRWVRHPLYVAGLLFFVGAGAALANWFVLGFAAAFVLVWTSVVIPREEEALRTRFGDEYEEYRRRTGALFPRL